VSALDRNIGTSALVSANSGTWKIKAMGEWLRNSRSGAIKGMN